MAKYFVTYCTGTSYGDRLLVCSYSIIYNLWRKYLHVFVFLHLFTYACFIC